MSQTAESLRHVRKEELGSVAAVVTITHLLNASYDLDAVLRDVMDVALTTFGAQRGFVVLAEEEPRVAVARGLEGHSLEAFSRTVVTRVLETGQPLLTQDASLDARLSASHSLRLLNARSVMCAPMHGRDGVLGLLYLDNLFTAGVFTDTHLELLTIVAGLAGSALERARYFTGMSDKAERLAQAIRQLRESQDETVLRLSIAAEYRDEETAAHIQRVSRYCAVLARRLGQAEPWVDLLRAASPLHDIGKIGISDAILRKPGRYTPEEFEEMKQHTVIGGRILAGSDTDMIHLGEEIALSHHERWDGSGYPRGLRGEEIPLSGRIVAVADVFDALTTERCYKPAFSPEKAFQILSEGRGSHFDPAVAERFLDSGAEILAIRDELAGTEAA